jgi:SAM-dependent methyltransferase
VNDTSPSKRVDLDPRQIAGELSGVVAVESSRKSPWRPWLPGGRSYHPLPRAFLRSLAALRKLKAAYFLRSATMPYGRGYGAYRRLELERAVGNPEFDSVRLPPRYGRWLDERIVEYPWVLSRLPDAPGVLLDAGSALNFDFLLSHPKVAGKKVFVSTLAPEERCFWDRGVSYVYEDLRATCYRESYFDWAVCLSTIEHIGMNNTMFYSADQTKCESDHQAYLIAIRQLHRVLKPGGKLLLTVPFGRASCFDWLQIFDAEMLETLIAGFPARSRAEWYFRYSESAWKQCARQDAADATYFDVHRQQPYCGCPAAAEALACLELAKR